MDWIQILTLGVFAVTILAVIVNRIDSTAVALVGVVAMIWIGSMSEVEAFLLVDWNVMAILVGIWVIAGYFGRSGVPGWLSVQALRLSGGRPGLLVMILSMLAGLISIFVDNVVVILMLAPVALPLARAMRVPIAPMILMIGFSANFMGTALLLGDLPPQMLHSVSGIEFDGFIWQHGRPSSFPILMVTFVVTLAFMGLWRFRGMGRATGIDEGGIAARIPDPLFAAIAVGMLILTVLGMAFREALGVKLGFISMTGAVLTVLLVEGLGKRLKAPRFEEIFQELDWRAIFFYIALFALVGGLEKTHILEMLATAIRPIFADHYALGATLLYWISVPIVGVVEHDAYILTFLYTIRDLGAADGVPTWPLWWMLLWSGTLGSNLTIAGAPALFVALGISEREEGRKIPLREFLGWSVPFTLVATFVCYVFGMLIWVLPFAA